MTRSLAGVKIIFLIPSLYLRFEFYSGLDSGSIGKDQRESGVDRVLREFKAQKRRENGLAFIQGSFFSDFSNKP